LSITFASPSMRAAGSDLTVSISPLGLVELADEEFEVHGPRLNRYSQNWAFYLGHHWAYRREQGEPQFAFNYVRALSDFITNFTFSKGVHFRSVPQYAHIIPALLKKVWEVDNVKEQVLWEMGQQGGVSGDSFVKIAWEPPYEDSVGQPHPGRVRILPLHPAHCFPEWHPHDRDRLLRFKLKYRFWGTAPEGTRQVFTYTEIITEELIEEYVNDEMIDQRPNPLGEIPIVHIPNVRISGSPWGLSDIADIIGLNREYNEKALEISDIINYHSAPVTIMTGAKMTNLERGPKKVWAVPNEKAQVFNLEGGSAGVPPALEYMELIKKAMHEMTGVPEGALGEAMPISNTSGVALAMTYQPMMQRYHMKRLTYGEGLVKINALVLKTLYIFDPTSMVYDPSTEGMMEEGQAPAINPVDPLAYRSVIHWPPPLPQDQLIALNEIQTKLALNLESKRGALKDLGEEFPDEKAEEIFEELKQDTIEAGALQMFKTFIEGMIISQTGIIPAPPGQPPQIADQGGDSSGSSTTQNSQPGPLPGIAPTASLIDPTTQRQLTSELVTLAYGTKLAQRRNPEND
jgi:hypothetical protein